MLAIKALVTLALAFVTGQAAGTVLPPTDQVQRPKLEARKWLCNIDRKEVADACRQQYNGDWLPGYRNDKCNGWYCAIDGRQRGISMETYCTDRYGSNAYATCDKSLWDWQCHDRT